MNLTMDSEHLAIPSNVYTRNYIFHDGRRAVVTITTDGRVILAPGVDFDAASLAFWRALEEGAPGMCQRVLDERKKDNH